MKIAFLMGGQEPGADGVGDYSRLMAREIVATRPDVSCCLISLNDSVSKSIDSTPDTIANGIGSASIIPRLRLPRHISWPERITRAADFLQEQGAEAISLQFVPYSFHPKGIVSGLAQQLAPLARGRRVHVMCHELWIGYDASEPLKQKLVGRVQRHYVLALLKSLRPAVVHTSNELYVERMAKVGWKAELLPLFGNIPIISGTADSWLYPRLQEAGVNINSSNREQFWIVAFFGSLHPVWPPEPVFSYIREAAKAAGKKVVLVSAGRIGAGKALWEEMAQAYQGDFTFVTLGALSDEHLSGFFNSADFGIATTPYALIGKSGSAVGMLEHGLPVIVNRDELKVASVQRTPSLPHLIKMKEDLPSVLATGIPRGPARSRLPEVANAMLTALGTGK